MKHTLSETIKFRILLISLLLTFTQVNIYSQVVIGSGEKPSKGALLQLKNIRGISGGEANATKGLMMPRVTLSKKTELYPMFLNDPENPASGSNDNYQINKNTIDSAHIGLIVFNMTENLEEVLCMGLNFWDGKKWNCLNGSPIYTMDCNSVAVNGTYNINQALDGNTHNISMSITAESKAIGQIYHIKTDTIDGIYFEGKGKITATSQTVILQGKGTPTSESTKYFTISSNSVKSNSTCRATVVTIISAKRVLVLGAVDLYGWVPGKSGFGSYEVLKSPNNFGTNENSVVKVENVDIIFPEINGAPSAAKATTIINYLTTNPVDICYIGQDIYLYYSSGEESHLEPLRQALIDYVNNKGVLVFFWEANPQVNGSAQVLFRELFNDNTIVQKRVRSTDGGGGIFMMSKTIKDDITAGPFGDVREKHWGEDASWAMSVSVPTNQVDVYSWGDDIDYANDTETHGYATGFKHKSLNLVYFGDGGFPSSVYSETQGNTSTSATACPFSWNPTTMFPIPKSKYGYGIDNNIHTIYNSTIWCNTMAWALYQAEVNGINTP